MDSRTPCVTDPQRPDNCGFTVCAPPLAYSCNARGCVCVEPAAPTLACSFTVSYPADNPGNVMVTPPPDACPGLEIALAALLAKLLSGK